MNSECFGGKKRKEEEFCSFFTQKGPFSREIGKKLFFKPGFQSFRQSKESTCVDNWLLDRLLQINAITQFSAPSLALDRLKLSLKGGFRVQICEIGLKIADLPKATAALVSSNLPQWQGSLTAHFPVPAPKHQPSMSFRHRLNSLHQRLRIRNRQRTRPTAIRTYLTKGGFPPKHTHSAVLRSTQTAG